MVSMGCLINLILKGGRGYPFRPWVRDDGWSSSASATRTGRAGAGDGNQGRCWDIHSVICQTWNAKNPIPLILNTPLETMVFWCFFLGISTAFGPFGGCLTLDGITPFMGIFYGQEQPTWYVDVHSGHQTWAGKSTIDEWVSLLKSPPIRRDSLLPRFDYQRVLYVYVSIKFDICI
jgi:hypothetical protein